MASMQNYFDPFNGLNQWILLLKGKLTLSFAYTTYFLTHLDSTSVLTGAPGR
jgi:hypothetical protein